MFRREHHRRIASILDALDGPLLEENKCLFGGGTAIALKYGEFRESLDIDFLVSDVDGYRALRQRMGHKDGIEAITRVRGRFTQLRQTRTDQYGIRTLLDAGGTRIKVEIRLEGRIALDVPEPVERICGVAVLTTLDLATSQLLANADRWADDSTHSRDLIDLAMMKLDRAFLRRAIEKASAAYGTSVEECLKKAVEALKNRRGRLEACMRALQMVPVPAGVSQVPLAVLWSDIKRLVPRARNRGS